MGQSPHERGGTFPYVAGNGPRPHRRAPKTCWPGPLSDLVTALGLVLVIEGLVLALVPDALKRMLAQILLRPTQALRLGGLIFATIGVAIVWLVRH